MDAWDNNATCRFEVIRVNATYSAGHRVHAVIGSLFDFVLVDAFDADLRFMSNAPFPPGVDLFDEGRLLGTPRDLVESFDNLEVWVSTSNCDSDPCRIALPSFSITVHEPIVAVRGAKSTVGGEFQSDPLSVVGGTQEYVFEGENVPEGLWVDAESGVIHGSFGEAGELNATTISVWDTRADVVKRLELIQWYIYDQVEVSGRLDQHLEVVAREDLSNVTFPSLNVSGGDVSQGYTYSGLNVPQGFKIDFITGHLRHEDVYLQTAGNYTFQVIVTDVHNSSDSSPHIELTVLPALEGPTGCPPSHFGDGVECEQCPVHSHSAAGARTIFECRCANVFGGINVSHVDYYDMEDSCDEVNCTQCSVCEAGEYMFEPCTEIRDTQCVACPSKRGPAGALSEEECEPVESVIGTSSGSSSSDAGVAYGVSSAVVALVGLAALYVVRHRSLTQDDVENDFSVQLTALFGEGAIVGRKKPREIERKCVKTLIWPKQQFSL